MQLAEQGKLLLDTPVQTYLPHFTIADTRGAAITVRHLLNQTSGLTDRTFPEMSLPQPDTLAAAVERLSTATLVATPGTDWNYHNSNYHLAAALVETVSGKPFPTYLERHVFDPLEMADSTSVDCGQEPRQLASGHLLAYGLAVALPEPDYFCTGSGAVVSTAHDMARWLLLHTNHGAPVGGARMISTESIAAMHTPPTADAIYGMGWYQARPADGRGPLRISHSGVMGTSSAYQGIFPSTGYGIVVLLNGSSPWADPYTLANGVLELVAGVTPAPSLPPGPAIERCLAALTLVTLAFGIRALVRSRAWAERRGGRPAWRNALMLLPHLTLVVLFLALPTLGSALLGRDGTWTMLLYSFLAPLVWLATAALCSAGIIIARSAQLIRHYRQRETT